MNPFDLDDPRASREGISPKQVPEDLVKTCASTTAPLYPEDQNPRMVAPWRQAALWALHQTCSFIDTQCQAYGREHQKIVKIALLRYESDSNPGPMDTDRVLKPLNLVLGRNCAVELRPIDISHISGLQQY